MYDQQITNPYAGLNLRDCFLQDFQLPERSAFVVKNVIFDQEYMLQVTQGRCIYMFVPVPASLQMVRRQWLYARFDVQAQKFTDARPGVIREPSLTALTPLFGLAQGDNYSQVNDTTLDKLWQAKVADEDSPYSFWDNQFKRLYGPLELEAHEPN